MRPMRQLWILFVLLIGFGAGLMTPGGTAYPDGYEREWEDDDHDYDRARRALSRGEILPMAQLLERLHARIPGEVVEVELEREDGVWVYEFKVIDRQGRLLEVYVAAESGEILAIEDE